MWSVVPYSRTGAKDRWDSEYYDPVYLEIEERLKEVGCTSLVNIASDIRCGPFGSAIRKEDYRASGTPLIRVADTSQFFINSNDLVFIDQKLSGEMARYVVKPGDIVVSQRGTIAQFAMVTDEYKKWVISANLISILHSKKVDFGYLLAFLNSSLGLSQMMRLQSGQVQPKIVTDDVKSLCVYLPSQKIQREIGDLTRKSYRLLRRSNSLYAQAETLLLSELGLDDLDLSPQLTYTQNFSQVWAAGRLDAEYFSPKYQRAMKVMRQSGKLIGDVARLAKRRFEAKPGKPFHYIEIGDLDQAGYAESKLVPGEEAPSRAQWIVKPGDVITSTVRPIRRLSALIEPEQDGYVCSSGFAVLKPTAIEAEVLLVYLRLPIVCEILDLHTTASMYPAISTTDLLNVPIPLPSAKIRGKIVDLIRESRKNRREAKRLLEEAKRRVEALILGENA